MPTARLMRSAGLLLLLASHAAAFNTQPIKPRSPTPKATTSAAPAALSRPATTSVVGATALVAGTTIGAGILALPAKTLEAGFGPSAIALVGSWAYMAATALLIAEVNVNTLCATERKAVSIKSMAQETIGDVGTVSSSLAYPFIHYCLLIAYMLEGGKLLGELAPSVAAFESSLGLPGAAGFAALGGGALLLGSEAQVDKANSVFFIGVLVSFALLVGVGSSSIDPTYLAHASPAAALPAIPVMVLSFTFHNVVPTIAYQLGCDLEKIKVAILAGSAIPLAMFLLWNGVVLGAVPYDAAIGVAGTFDPLETLRASGETFGEIVRVFSLLAIVTSFIGFCYGLVDFYADVLNVDEKLAAQQQQTVPSAFDEDDVGEISGGLGDNRPLPVKAGLFALALLPPLAIATTGQSGLFFAALDNAGTYGILTLFGIIPCSMAWSMRYGPEAEPFVPPALPGGKLTLGAMIGGAVVVIGLELAEKFGGAFA